MATPHLTAMINSYCRAFINWSCYEGIPQYDSTLAGYFAATGYQLHLRLDFTTIGKEVFLPLRYFSESGYHVFDFPAVERELATDQLVPIDAAHFLVVVTEYLKDSYPQLRLRQALDNLAAWPAPALLGDVSMASYNACIDNLLQAPAPKIHLVQRLLRIIAILGYQQQADETTLLQQAYQSLEQHQPDHPLLQANRLSIPCELLSFLHGEEVIYRPFPNPLHKAFFSPALIQPKGKDHVYSRYFPKENITVSIRPFDIDRDLEMVHEWFNREHAKKIWKMDWPLRELETYYRTMLPGNAAHSYIGEIDGTPTYNFEVYWVVRDLLCDYYDALPTDYGTHQFIAPVDPKQKFASPSTQSMLDWVFAQPQVGKMVGEGSVESLAALMNKAHVGFRVERVIELPHKKANLNFCYREWYWAKFPENRHITTQKQTTHATTVSI
ncbi:acetyltransferase [Chitinophaga agrisoli]|uniref:Acetyltransferase n=1 Tax=Chitinophaga agrisoli TaxID=2607653 RepID=A0A5B2W699_9BACT|nr:GNAT family N-acetyltransferase [Chitinophaga agrisoli]KAA2245749.1 acetyltransferase [Chitinophaga agrisoli]